MQPCPTEQLNLTPSKGKFKEEILPNAHGSRIRTRIYAPENTRRHQISARYIPPHIIITVPIIVITKLKF